MKTVTIVLAFLQPTIKCLVLYLIFRFCVLRAENYVGNELSYSLLLSSSLVSFLIWWLLNICIVIYSLYHVSTGVSSGNWLTYLIYSVVEWLLVFGFIYLTIRMQENYKKNKFAYSLLLHHFNYSLSIYFVIRFFVFGVIF